MEWYPKKYLHVKGLANIFAKYSPSEKKMVYSI